MKIQEIIKNSIQLALQALYHIENAQVIIEKTSSDFSGDFTFVVFPFLRLSKKSPELTAQEIGNYILENTKEIESINVIKGFLNIQITDAFYIQFLDTNALNLNYSRFEVTNKKILIEYSSPNTNKPLHLGHVRNNLLGYSVYRILERTGNTVKTCNLINDRGIHICKSMLAWVKAGMQDTPEITGEKGDHFVGRYYVAFDKLLKEQVQMGIQSGLSEENAEKQAPILLEAQEMLRKWEAGDAETIRIWKLMNSWVYRGFEESYKTMGVHFDTYYYESDIYLSGKALVYEGLSKNKFYQKDDQSIWVDLVEDNLDQKLLLRSDGTSVYITQDIGTADLKYKEFPFDQSIYVVGNEQDYHFKVLKLILKRLEKSYADSIFHLSYGMVELPFGKMKSREGTVVDADDLMNEMFVNAEEITKALGKTEGLVDTDLQKLYRTIGLGALKYFLLKVDPKKKMLFNPAESIDFQGNTGPFIQYTYARIRSVLRNAGDWQQSISTLDSKIALTTEERELLRLCYSYPEILKTAAAELSPGVICNYAYELARAYNLFYHHCQILKESDLERKKLRIAICAMTSSLIQDAFGLLGIEVPERM